MSKIAIIGAGVSGVAAVKCCLDEGLDPVCFERDDRVGGLWRYTEKTGLPRVGIYKSLHMNSSKFTSVFSDYPAGEEDPWYWHHEQFLAYVEDYANHFGLLPYINFGVTIHKVAPLSGQECMRWEVIYCKNGQANFQKEVFDGVMVCSGMFSGPLIPDIPGLDSFKGEVLHSNDYREPHAFKDKTVLVVGLGGSTADIASGVSGVTKKVMISVGDGAWMIPRLMGFSLPWEVFLINGISLMIPDQTREALVTWFLRLAYLDHDAVGLTPTHRRFGEEYAAVTDTVVGKLVTQQIKLRPMVSHIEPNKVVYTDGSHDEVDAIILGTGFKSRIPFLPDHLTPFTKDKKFGCYRAIVLPNPDYKSLCFIGWVRPFGGFAPVVEMQARWWTRVFKGEIKLPLKEQMEKQVKTRLATQRTPRHRHVYVAPDLPPKYQDELVQDFGLRPRAWRYLFSDPYLAWCLLVGPYVPAWYRLEGPGAWPGAKQTIKDTMTYFWRPIRVGGTRRQTILVSFLKLFLKFIAVMLVLGFLLIAVCLCF